MNKYNYKKHFLDSNIVIGCVISWDNSNNDCHTYLKKEWYRTTSERVYEECEKVISRYRKLQGTFLESFKKYLEGTNQDKLIIAFDTKFDKFVDYFIRENLKKGNVFSLPKNKFRNSVLNFANECRELIRNALINSRYDSLISDCRHAFNEAIEKLENICYHSDIIKTFPTIFETYAGHYFQYEKKLKDIGIHSPDDKIILDCYYFMENEFKEDIAFITKDKSILKASYKIESLLKGTYIHTI